MNREIIAWLLVGLLLGLGVGAYYGANKVTEWGLNMVWALMDRQKITVGIDKQMLINGINQYKHNIGGCLFLENTSINLNEIG